jgi:hypothetical protein
MSTYCCSARCCNWSTAGLGWARYIVALYAAHDAWPGMVYCGASITAIDLCNVPSEYFRSTHAPVAIADCVGRARIGCIRRTPVPVCHGAHGIQHATSSPASVLPSTSAQRRLLPMLPIATPRLSAVAVRVYGHGTVGNAVYCTCDENRSRLSTRGTGLLAYSG